MGIVSFDSGKANLRPKRVKLWQSFPGIVLNYPCCCVGLSRVITTTPGTPPPIRRLSEQRANAVRDSWSDETDYQLSIGPGPWHQESNRQQRHN